VTIIQQQQIDILLDMQALLPSTVMLHSPRSLSLCLSLSPSQLYTLGHRLEITARQPSSLQVNYLVYPATSGASFLQYLIADQIVVSLLPLTFMIELILEPPVGPTGALTILLRGSCSDATPLPSLVLRKVCRLSSILGSVV
jgi:hypothetical protein